MIRRSNYAEWGLRPKEVSGFALCGFKGSMPANSWHQQVSKFRKCFISLFLILLAHSLRQIPQQHFVWCLECLWWRKLVRKQVLSQREKPVHQEKKRSEEVAFAKRDGCHFWPQCCWRNQNPQAHGPWAKTKRNAVPPRTAWCWGQATRTSFHV